MLLRNRPDRIETNPHDTAPAFKHLDVKAIAVLRWLLANRVDLVLVGDVARAIRGDRQATGPPAIVPAPYGRNLERLLRALHSARARPRSESDHNPHEVKLAPDDLVGQKRFTLCCGEHEIDIEGRPRGVPRYQELLYEANRFELAPGVDVEVASPEDIEHYEQMRLTGEAPEIVISRRVSADRSPT